MKPEVRRTYDGGEVIILGLTERQLSALAYLIRDYGSESWMQELAGQMEPSVLTAQRAFNRKNRLHDPTRDNQNDPPEWKPTLMSKWTPPLLYQVNGVVEVGRNHPGLNEPEEEAS